VFKKVNTKVCRHSFATVLKRSGVSKEFIHEELGRHDLKTTENYLDSFELEAKRRIAAYLTAFIMPSVQLGFSSNIIVKEEWWVI